MYPGDGSIIVTFFLYIIFFSSAICLQHKKEIVQKCIFINLSSILLVTGRELTNYNFSNIFPFEFLLHLLLLLLFLLI